MKKTDLHLHLTVRQIPRIGKLDLASAGNMLAHLDELGIAKGVLMSAGEKRVPFGNNAKNRLICEKYPERCIRLPMREDARSLNLANSVAVLCYEALRQLDFPELT